MLQTNLWATSPVVCSSLLLLYWHGYTVPSFFIDAHRAIETLKANVDRRGEESEGRQEDDDWISSDEDEDDDHVEDDTDEEDAFGQARGVGMKVRQPKLPESGEPFVTRYIYDDV